MDQAPDLTIQLPRDTYWQAVHDLQSTLPPPPGEDTEENRAHRDRAAIAEIASLLPANGDEVTIAVRCVAAHARSMECIRLANRYYNDPATILKCNAQSALMMRTAGGARALLLRVQSARQKREANPTELNKAAWIEHCAIGLMADVLGETPPPPMPEPAPEPPAHDPGDKFAQLTEEEQYAVIYPDRATQIRAAGGLPPGHTWGPPDLDLVQKIVASTSHILRALDRPISDRDRRTP